MICLQETCLFEHQINGPKNFAHRIGFQMNTIPAGQFAEGGRGGLAILAKLPFGLKTVHSVVNQHGLIPVCKVFGANLSLTIINAYKRPGTAHDDLLTDLLETIQQHGNQNWILCMDWNTDPSNVEAFIHPLGGRNVASAQHVAGSHPIDSIWLAQTLEVASSGTLDPLSDHEGMAVSIKEIAPSKIQGAYQLRPCPVLSENTFQPNNALSWTPTMDDDEREHLVQDSNIELMWAMWTQEAELFLRHTGLVRDTTHGTRSFGTMPQLTCAPSKRGPYQGHRERQLRRCVRSIQEILTISRHGRAPPASLLKRVQHRCRQFRVDTTQNQWAHTHAQILKMLDDEVRRVEQAAIRSWRGRMKDNPYKWVAQEAATPWLLGKTNGAESLRQTWADIFGSGEAKANVEAYFTEYQSFLAPCQSMQIAPLTPQLLRKADHKMIGKAAGMDGWTAKALHFLPDKLWARWCSVLQAVEATHTWPRSMYQWRICFLPKGKDTITTVQSTRPIAIGSIMYRAWARCRAKRVAEAFATSPLATMQSGGTGIDCEPLLLEFLQNETTNYPFGLSLDYAKAFDSTDGNFAIAVFRHWGIPDTLCNTIWDMWQKQARWVAWSNNLAKDPITDTWSLPQGDPWSPLGLAAVLSGPARKVEHQCPSIKACTYLDDRSVRPNSGRLDELCPAVEAPGIHY